VTASERKRLEGSEGDGDDRTPGWWQSIGDRGLVGAIREGRPEAVDEFIRRFEELVMRSARQLQIPREERAHWVGEVLYEVALTLGRSRGPAPNHLAAYVAGACKRRGRRERARASTRDARIREAVGEVYASGESVALGVCSEDSLRLACGVDWESPRLSPVLARLAAAFDAEITAEERDVLSWLGQHVSYTTIAEWLGISRPAAVSRIQRLRARLIRTTLRFGAALEAAERAQLLRFLRRAGVSDARLLAPQTDTATRGEDADDQT
jgi:DNA-binding CsgD family transcriptional regulator